MAGPSYVTVCLDHGHRFQIVMPDFQRLFDACQEYKRSGQDQVFLTKETCGGQAFFYLSKIAHIAMSTPQIRDEDRRIDNLIEQEEKESRQSWE